jgi:hypothetical protein
MYMSEVLFGIIVFYPDKRFPVSPLVLHPAIFELKSRYPDFFDQFNFDIRNGFPYSKEMELYINLFRLAGILELSSSETPEILENLREESKRNHGLKEGKLKKLEQIAQELYENITPTNAA